MKLVISTIALVWLAMPAGPASAQPVDCEAARCTVQAEIDAECPCAEAKNHGRYTSCVARIVNRLSREGTIPRKCRNKINGCAIRSTCGKRDGAVSCDFPGDGVSGRCRPLSSADTCTKRGGTIVSSCCESCGAVPTATPEEPTPTATPEGPVATATPGGEPTETPAETATPGATSTEPGVATPTATETPAATVTESPIATATEGPIATPTEGTVATPTEGPVTTATPTEGPIATATESPSATITTEAPTPTATPGETSTPVPTATSTPSAAVCGDNVVSGTEACDPPGQASCPNAGNGLEICSMGCTCDCPSRISFTGDAADPMSVLDTGWTGIAHRAPIITNGDVTVAVTCPDPTQRPCGTCATSGPVANTQPGQLDNRRCSNDTAIHCTDNTPCTGGTCEYFFGSNLPLAAGGVTTCVVNQFNGPVSGTANIESGEAVTTALLTSRVYNGIAIDNPCPRCIGDATLNDDGATTGTCDGGLHPGGACDANGSVPGRPDFGTTSLDCPPSPGGIIATLPIDLTSATDTVAKTLTADSPACTGAVGDKCLCDTCNNLAATPCSTNADCPVSGGAPGICGGRRCLSGPNNGQPCSANSGCPSGACTRAGTPTAPSGCVDDTTISDRVLECADPDGDGEGSCTIGPTDQNCTVASGHAQRGCNGDADCGGAVGSCESVQRSCFLTGGGTANIAPNGVDDGTNSLVAIGVEDPPVNDVSHPTLAAVFCVGPTSAPAVNTVAGLPGPGRTTLRGTALGLP